MVAKAREVVAFLVSHGSIVSSAAVERLFGGVGQDFAKRRHSYTLATSQAVQLIPTVLQSFEVL